MKRTWRADLVKLPAPERITGAAVLGWEFLEPEFAIIDEDGEIITDENGEVITVAEQPPLSAPEPLPTPVQPDAGLVFWQPTTIEFFDPPAEVEEPPQLSPVDIERILGQKLPKPPFRYWRRWSQWEPKLRALLARTSLGAGIDERRLVARQARLLPCKQLPRRPWVYWPTALEIWIEDSAATTCIKEDYQQVAKRLSARIGPDFAAGYVGPNDWVRLRAPVLWLGVDPQRVPRAATWSVTPGFWGHRSGQVPQDELAYLLTLTSVASRMSPSLLRDLRCLISSSPALESAFLGRPEVEVGFDGIVWASGQADGWRQKFVQLDRSLQLQVLNILRRHHDGPAPTELWWEELALLQQLVPELVAPEQAYIQEYAESYQRYFSQGPRPSLAGQWSLASYRRFGQYQKLPAAYRQVVHQAQKNQGQKRVVGLESELLPPTQRPTRNFRLDQEGHFWVLRPKEAPVLGSPIVELPAAATLQFVGADGTAQEFDVDVARIKWPALKGAPVQVVTDRAQVTLEAISQPDWASGIGRDKYGLVANVTVEGVDFRMRWVPPGRFRMGSPENEEGRDDDEGPQHLVVHPQGFWLGETPVTQQLWEGVMGQNPARFKASFHPVEGVSWNDVKKFLAALQEKFDVSFDLPSEAEWEYACRAGTTTATYAGDLEILGRHNAPLLDKIGWYGGNCGVEFELPGGGDTSGWPEKQYNFKYGGTHAVGLKAANPWGMYDILGNVWEWCRDGQRKYSEQAQALTSPVGPQDPGVARVVRGGSWGYVARNLRAANRLAIGPGGAIGDLGFRLCRGPAPRTSPADPASRLAKGPGPIQGPAAGPQDGGGPEAQARAPEGSRAAPRGRSRRPKTPGEK